MIQKSHPKWHILRPARDARRADEAKQRLRRRQLWMLAVDLVQRGHQRRGRGLADRRVVKREQVEGEGQFGSGAKAADDRVGEAD